MSLGIDAALAKLRYELEGMQKQDKALYTQLLTLQESIRGLKTELKKEREECEEAFRDLEISGKEVEDEVFLAENQTAQDLNEKEAPKEVWKHERQDSGIFVRTPEAETQDMNLLTNDRTKHITQGESNTSTQVPKPELIPYNKQDLDAHGMQPNVETAQKITSTPKPGLIQHSKQDSGILIDEEAVRGTKLLSRLVGSSEMFEYRKFDRMVQNKWQLLREPLATEPQAREQPLSSKPQAREQPPTRSPRGQPLINEPQADKQPQVNRSNTYHHQRSRSSNDLLNYPKTLPRQYSTPGQPGLSPQHSHTNSCPQTTLLDFTLRGNAGKQSFKQSTELDKELKTSHGVNNGRKPSIKHFNELGKEVNTDEQLGKSREGLKRNASYSQGVLPADNRPAVNRRGSNLAMKPGSKPALAPRHSYSRSLPSTNIRGRIMTEKEMKDSRLGNRSVPDYRVVPAHQLRPRQRSASVVDLDSLKEATDSSNDLIQNRESFRDNTFLTPRKANVVHINNMKQVTTLTQNKANENGESVQSAKPLRVVLVSAGEVNPTNIPERRVLSRKSSLDERGSGNHLIGASDVTGPQRRFTFTSLKTDGERPGKQFQNGGKSPRFLSPASFPHPRNHLRHQTMPEYDAMRRRHSLHISHAPSKSWDGYASRTHEVKGVMRSSSQISLV